MDSLITAAARALAAGDPLGALKRVALRDDPPALALRGIAMAQLGDLERAKALLKRAIRAFAPRESLARARCVVAQAEVALAARDLNWPMKALHNARGVLEQHADWANAAHARHVEIRRHVLLGQLGEAEACLVGMEQRSLPPALQAAAELLVAGIAMRRVQARRARAALMRARRAARRAAIASLMAEVDHAFRLLNAPAARRIHRGEAQLVTLAEVEALYASDALLVDECRYVVRDAQSTVLLARRPVLFTLARALAEAWPAEVPRRVLIERAFRIKLPDETHRARLRVEIGRLRAALRPLAGVQATPLGFAFTPGSSREVVVLARPVTEKHAEVFALLADGELWATSALAMALSASQRTVQRAMESLLSSGKVQSMGRGRALRWMMPPAPGFATSLLLPSALPES